MGEVSSKHYILAKFQVFYTVDKPSSDWKGGVGYISKDMVLKGLPGPGEDSLVLVSSFLNFCFRVILYIKHGVLVEKNIIIFLPC
jgi:NAD(P)H-flavin reductase